MYKLTSQTMFVMIMVQSTEMMTSQKTFIVFQHFGYHVRVEHDEKHPRSNLVGIGSWGPRDVATWNQCKLAWFITGQFTLISVGLIRYSCSHISGPNEPIHVKFGVSGFFFIMFYWNMVMKMLKCTTENLMMSHFSTLQSLGFSFHPIPVYPIYPILSIYFYTSCTLF